MTDLADTLAERGARYGDFNDHAALAQKLQDVMREPDGWANLSPVKRQSLTVIADKIARILSGDPEYRDNWHDIAGYAKLAHDRCVDTDGPGLPLEQVADDAAGWIGWAGGECPVAPLTRVKVRLTHRDDPATYRADDINWFTGTTVIAYKVVD